MSPALRRRQLFGLLRRPEPLAGPAPAEPPAPQPPAPSPPAASQPTASQPTASQPAASQPPRATQATQPARPDGFSLARFYQGREAAGAIPHFTVKTPREPVAATSVGSQREPRRG